MQIIKKLSPNYTAGRKGRKPIAIVNHITAGLMPGCLSWMCNPAAKASAHYLVTRKGEVYQLVEDANASWHAGEVKRPNWPLYDGSNPNRYTIGIEHEGKPNEPLTEAQYQATLALHQQLIQKHGIPVDRDHIIGHYRIDSVNRPNCPGPKFPWDRLFTDLRGDEDMLSPVKIKINGKDLPNGHIAKLDGKDTSFAPVRALAEALGAKVDWDAATSTVVITK